MATTHSPRRPRKIRRFSSGTVGWPPGSPRSIASAPLRPHNHSRQVSLSPPPATSSLFFRRRLRYGEGSDYENEEPSFTHTRHRRRSLTPDSHMFERGSRPAAYSSLPPTPLLTSRPYTPPTPVSPISPNSPAFPPEEEAPPSTSQAPPFSLWDYLREELLATDFDSHQEMKWERVSNFLSMPLAMEKVSTSLTTAIQLLNISEPQIIGFGFILCFDSFLYTFTILPIRFALALFRFLMNLFKRSAPPLPPSQKADLLRALLLIVSLLILNPLTDASKIYHAIRGQDTIKLYVIFNALEVCEIS